MLPPRSPPAAERTVHCPASITASSILPRQILRSLAAWFADRPQMPYLIPLMAYLLIMSPATFGHLAGIDWETLWRSYHPLIYFTQNAVAAILLWCFWDYYAKIRWTHLPLAVLVGLFGTILWVGVEYACQHIHLTTRPDPTKFYNPDLLLPTTAARWTYLCIRIVGPTLVVPVMEELFFRDFLMRPSSAALASKTSPSAPSPGSASSP